MARIWLRIQILLCGLVVITGCEWGKPEKPVLWVYTSMYKDTIQDLKTQLDQDLPGVEIKWYQAGSEEIAAKVNAELIAGHCQADVLISSDRFWYEELSDRGFLHAYRPPNGSEVPDTLRHPQGFYSTVSIPVMVMVYNGEVFSQDEVPKSFKEMADPKWKGKLTTGSPLASGTNFTTVAMLQNAYGWEYIEALRRNETISQGGNSGVLRRIQSKERPIGWVLMENLLRLQKKDKRIKTLYPADGVVIQSNVMAITKKPGESREWAEKLANWLYSKKGQEAMTRSYMYSPLASVAPPEGAPPFSDISKSAFPWTQEFLSKVVKERQDIKERFSQIMFD
ncbi:MAG: extracellular solute-binding protein [Bdellovibrionaceae bacterium]|nr:extracellular solute-binding protein [Bdellovibrionales bacterium]MCB9083392.1 extracellular solute-binding protein [Pseudobdellovibrionaceae bacterium]